MDDETFNRFMDALGAVAPQQNNVLAATICVVASHHMQKDGPKVAKLYVFRMLKQIGQIAEWAETQRLSNHLPTYAELEREVLDG